MLVSGEVCVLWGTILVYFVHDILFFFFFLMIGGPPGSTRGRPSAASEVYKEQVGGYENPGWYHKDKDKKREIRQLKDF